MNYQLPELYFAYDALEPYIDAETVEIHHDRHHAKYTEKFNQAIEENGLGTKTVEDIFSKVSKYPDSVRNNGGGYYNHNLYWENLTPNGGGLPEGELLKAIEKYFGSFEKFKKELSGAAASQFGSGWAWLISTGDGLRVISTPNQDNSLMDISQVKGKPLLALDVWEHAYYLKYKNKRPEYITQFWNIINWDAVARRFVPI